MSRIAFFLSPVLALTLTACAQSPARPVSVDLTRDLLEVRMSDETVCSGPAPAEGAEAGWSGRFEGCAWPYAYDVAIEPGANPLRFALQEVFAAIGLEDALAPLAQVTITDSTGRARVFASPPEVDFDD